MMNWTILFEIIEINAPVFVWSLHNVTTFEFNSNKSSAGAHNGKSAASNGLWHMDSHHSLIRWDFLLHGEIERYYWLIPFLQCSANNKTDTAVSLFE